MESIMSFNNEEDIQDKEKEKIKQKIIRWKKRHDLYNKQYISKSIKKISLKDLFYLTIDFDKLYKSLTLYNNNKKK